VEGYEYSRTANPTRGALEECLAALEGGTRALAFASGMAAEDCLLRTVLRPGDHVLIPHDAYGGTYRLFDKVLQSWGVSYQPVPVSDAAAVSNAMQEKPAQVVWLETPTNPLLSIADITAIAEIAHARGAMLVVDSTFASPYLQQPLALGADVVVHSTTKYLGGHSDVIGGALVTADLELAQELTFHQNAMGAIAGPFDAWLVLRGLKTLGVRMDRHCANADRVATYLLGHPAISRVYYPGLPDHPGHEVAARQMRGFGGMLSFELKNDSAEELKRVVSSTKIIALAESLGGVESLINHPATMTHASIPREERLKNGLKDSLIRLSVGIEDADDLIEDLKQAIG
jgi:cystathionine gamma-synthase